MFLPENITISSFTFPSLALVIIVAYCHLLFVVWYEGKKDGFYAVTMFDIFIIATILDALFSAGYLRLVEFLKIYYYRSLLLSVEPRLGVLSLLYFIPQVTIIVAGKLKNWSYFRLLDIYALGLTIFLIIFTAGSFMIYGKGYYLFALPVLLWLYFKVLIYRGYKMASGISYFIFNSLLVMSGMLFLRSPGYLIIYTFLFTMGLSVIYLKQKLTPMNYKLPVDFIENLRNKLLKKDKELKRQARLIKEEDPYLQSDRQESRNVEVMDQAILEDVQKEISDNKRDLVAIMRLQVRKALAFMKVGRYGICEICGNPIDKARLSIYPEATRCLECASKSE